MAAKGGGGGGASAMAIAGSGLQAFSSIYGGYVEAQARDMQASLYRRSAVEKERRFEINKLLIEKEADALVSKQMVTAAGSGRALQGSVLDIAFDTKSKAAFEILRKQEEMEFEVANMHFQADLEEYYGDQAIVQGWISGAASLLG